MTIQDQIEEYIEDAHRRMAEETIRVICPECGRTATTTRLYYARNTIVCDRCKGFMKETQRSDNEEAK